MKRVILTTVIVTILAVAFNILVSADGGPHGGYTPTTDGCAGCHRAHTDSGPSLLVVSSTYNLCISCHGSAGTGADTNVDDGFFLSTRSISTDGTTNTVDAAPLLGGGFVYYDGNPVTSSHDVTGDGNTNVAWGNGATRGVGEAIVESTFTCTTCHDPHGSNNYRIFNTTINDKEVYVAQVDEGDAKDYDTEQWGAGQSEICGACHGAYHVTGGGFLATGGYTHEIDIPYNYGGNVNPETIGLGGFTLPLAESGTKDTVVCQTCHLPHGSSATMIGIADGGPDGDGTLPGDTTATDSALLRLDNRGVCQVCHQK